MTEQIKSKHQIGSIVTVNENPPWLAKVLAMRLNMEDGTFIYSLKGVVDGDRRETKKESELI